MKEFTTKEESPQTDEALENQIDAKKEEPTLSEQNVDLNPSCSMRKETSVDIIMPDRFVISSLGVVMSLNVTKTIRPMDLHLSLINSATLAEHQWPKEIQDHYILLKDL